MNEYPELATAVGYPGQNGRWTDYSDAAVDRRAQYVKDSLQRLLSIDRGQLAPDDQFNYDLYRDLIATAVAGLEFHNDAVPIRGVVSYNLLMPVNQMDGVQQSVPRTIAMMPAATVADYEDIVSRLRSVGPLVDQTIALMERGVAAGLTPPRITLRDLPAQVSAQLVDDPLKSPMLEAFRSVPASIPEAERARLTARGGRRLHAGCRAGVHEAARLPGVALSAGVPRDDGRVLAAEWRGDVRVQREMAYDHGDDAAGDP